MGRCGLDLVEHVLAAPRATGPVLVNSRGQGICHGELVAAVAAGARALRDSFGPTQGRAVVVCCEAPDAFLVASLAVLQAGAVLVPLTATTDATRRAQHARAIRPLAFITSATTEGELIATPGCARPREFDPDVALVLPTSGSSGVPKRVQLRSRGLIKNIDAILEYLPVSRWPRTGVLLPLSYSYGLVGQCLTTLRAGGTLVMLSDLGFPAMQVRAMRELGVQGVSSVSASLRQIARAVEDLDATERPAPGYLASAGGPLSTEVTALLRSAFPASRLFNQYGLTEASPRVTAISDDEEPFARGSVGRPIEGVQVQAMNGDRVCAAGEVGELVIRGPSVMKGYLDDEEGNARVLTPEGLRSGDLGYVDDEGYVFVAGRRDDLVNVAGERISTIEIARTLQTLDGVEEAYVVAIPDPVLGYRLTAIVEGHAEFLSAIRRAARSSLTPARRPARILSTRQLPRIPGGKLDRLRMRSWAEQGRVDEAGE